MMSLGTPAQRAAQVAASLGSWNPLPTYIPQPVTEPYVKQLFCLHPDALSNCLKGNPFFGTLPLSGRGYPDTTYPYIARGGTRNCAFEIHADSTNIWNTTCTLVITLTSPTTSSVDQDTTATTSSGGTSICIDKDTTIIIDSANPMTITMTGSLVSTYIMDGSQASANAQRELALPPTTPHGMFSLVWLVQFQKSATIATVYERKDGSVDTQLNSALDTVFDQFFQLQESSLFAPYTQLTTPEYEPFMDGTDPAPMLGLALAPCQDAEKTDLTSMVYIVLQYLDEKITPDRKPVATAEWIQQWCIPNIPPPSKGHPLSQCAMVVCRKSIWEPIFFALDWSHDPKQPSEPSPDVETRMGSLFGAWPSTSGSVQNWPYVAPTVTTKNWTTPGDATFSWVPYGAKFSGTPSRPFASSEGILSNQEVQVDSESKPETVTYRYVDRDVFNTLYFVPGYTCSDGTDVGPRLDMQSMFDPGTTKWQVAYFSKNTMDWTDQTVSPKLPALQAKFESYWLVFINFQEFVNDTAAFSVSSSAYLGEACVSSDLKFDKVTIKDVADVHQNLVDSWFSTNNASAFQGLVSDAIRVSMKLNAPASVGISATNAPFLNEDGDLITPFAF